MTRDEFNAAVLLLGGTIQVSGCVIHNDDNPIVIWNEADSQLCVTDVFSMASAAMLGCAPGKPYTHEEMLGFIVAYLEKTNDQR